MVWMLMRHQHRIKIGYGVPGVGEIPWINENSRAVGLGQHSRMPKVGDPHAPTVGAGSRMPVIGSWPLPGQQLAHQLTGGLAVVGRHIKMGNRPDRERPESGHPDSAL